MSMKGMVGASLVGLLLVGGALWLGNGRGAWFPTRQVDLGSVWAGEEREVLFPFTNDGGGDVSITGIVGNCTCASIEVQIGSARYRAGTNGVGFVRVGGETSSSMPAIVISPGQAGNLRLRLGTRGKKSGQQAARVQVYSSALERMVDLEASVFVRHKFVLEPDVIVLDDVGWRSEVGFSSWFKGSVGEPVLEFVPPGIACRIEPTDEADAWKIQGSVDVSEVQEPLVIKIGAPGLENIADLPVSLKVRKAFSVNPSSFVSFGRFDGRQGHVLEVTVIPEDGEEWGESPSVTVEECNRGTDALKCRLVEASPRGEKRFAISVGPGVEKGVIRGVLGIRTGHAFEKVIRLRTLGIAQ